MIAYSYLIPEIIVISTSCFVLVLDLFLKKGYRQISYYLIQISLIISTLTIINNYNSKIPEQKQELLNLKGIGDYTASAILTIGFNIKAIPVDGNIHRVMSRLHELSATKYQLSIIKNQQDDFKKEIDHKNKIE